MLLFLKFVCLVVGILYTFRNIVAAGRGLSISSAQMWLMAVPDAGFIALQFWLGV